MMKQQLGRVSAGAGGRAWLAARAVVGAAAASLVLGLALLGAGCAPVAGGNVAATPHVYAVASHSGGLYQIDEATEKVSDVPLLSTNQNATGEIVFHNGIGYVAVASWSNSAPGLYRFDPDTPSVGATRIGGTTSGAISAQYIAFASDTLAYVTSADYSKVYSDALYSFNPSNTAAGLAKVADLSFPQDVTIGTDRKVYVAENGSGKVARFNAEGTAVEAWITCTTTGATGLLAGTYGGKAGIFVGNSGPLDASWAYTNGSIDFIADSGTTAVAVVTGPVVGRLALLGTSTLLATGGYPAKTWAIDLSVASPAAAEVLDGAVSFGGSDINVYGNYAYIPDGATTVYVFSSLAGPVTRLTVGKSGELVTNVGIDF
ncbi:MAG: hypothetical protein ACOYM2_09055 [Rectinemataceae bacterium]